MTTTFRDTIGLHANALILREKRNEVLASNIANAATPNFKARDVDFRAALAAAGSGDSLAMAQTQGAHINAEGNRGGPGEAGRQPDGTG